MHTNTMMEPETERRQKLRVFTLYGDFPAGVRAKRLISRIGALCGRQYEVTAEMWKLDSVSPIGPIREMIAEEAGEADVLLLAISSVEQSDPVVVRWLQTLAPWKSNRQMPGLLVGYPGDEDRRVDEANWFVEQMVRFARLTQMDFAWQSAGRDNADDGDWLAAGLGRLLERKRNSSSAAPVDGAFPVVTAV